MVLYADVITKSIQETLKTTQYRREKQLAYNAEHGIVPQSVKRAIDESLQTPGNKYAEPATNNRMVAQSGDDETVADVIAELEAEMLEAARKLQFKKQRIYATSWKPCKRAPMRRDAGSSQSSKPKRSANPFTIKRGCHASAKRLGLAPRVL